MRPCRSLSGRVDTRSGPATRRPELTDVPLRRSSGACVRAELLHSRKGGKALVSSLRRNPCRFARTKRVRSPHSRIAAPMPAREALRGLRYGGRAAHAAIQSDEGRGEISPLTRSCRHALHEVSSAPPPAGASSRRPSGLVPRGARRAAAPRRRRGRASPSPSRLGRPVARARSRRLRPSRARASRPRPAVLTASGKSIWRSLAWSLFDSASTRTSLNRVFSPVTRTEIRINAASAGNPGGRLRGRSNQGKEQDFREGEAPSWRAASSRPRLPAESRQRQRPASN